MRSDDRMMTGRTVHRLTRRRFLEVTLATGVMAAGSLLASCRQEAATPVPGGQTPATGPTIVTTPGAVTEFPRNETFFVAGFQWGPPTTFNPMTPGTGWPAGQGFNTPFQHLYETLFGFNLLTGGLEPRLGQRLEQPDPATMVITLHAGTKWQDGQPLTADDVIFTFELAKDHPEVPHNTFFDYVATISKVDDRTIRLELQKDRLNPGFVKLLLSGVKILPKHIWEARAKSGQTLTEIVDTEPVGSGPYKLVGFSPERIALQRDDNYWGIAVFGTPAPKYIVHPIFKSNDEGNLALEQGRVDISQQFVPKIWEMWEKKNLPVGTWFKQPPYHVPGSIPLLFINVNKKPWDNPALRRALAHAINYAQIAELAMSRYSITANSSLIIPDGAEQKFFDQANVERNGWKHDPQRAVQILEQELGAKKGNDGIYVLPDGTRLGPFKVECPYGWTDWQTALELVAQSAKDVGIEINTEFPDAPVLFTRIPNGDFELALWFVNGVSPASPWIRFRDVLDSRGVPPVGQRAFWNYNRYNNPAVADLLDRAAAAQSEAEQKELFTELDRIFMRDAPAIPLMYRPLEFYEYNESVWTGFPNSGNPVAPPQQGGAGIKILYVIKPKS
ncbi:MAG: ABC transporter substrate-binding protein [Thermomicrobium sp.]|nr:ABC transporter substrate-binding protein [Thermomicrobium sp.]MDW7982168.1 ABC transporter substrate-binding protein [Thermomicrobium sp.]